MLMPAIEACIDNVMVMPIQHCWFVDFARTPGSMRIPCLSVGSIFCLPALAGREKINKEITHPLNGAKECKKTVA